MRATGGLSRALHGVRENAGFRATAGRTGRSARDVLSPLGAGSHGAYWRMTRRKVVRSLPVGLFGWTADPPPAPETQTADTDPPPAVVRLQAMVRADAAAETESEDQDGQRAGAVAPRGVDA